MIFTLEFLKTDPKARYQGYLLYFREAYFILQSEFYVGDEFPFCGEELLVVGLNTPQERGIGLVFYRSIDVAMGGEDFVAEPLEKPQSISVQEFGVGFEVDYPIWFQDFPVSREEVGVGKPVLRTPVFYLRVWKGDPDFIYFIFLEEAVDKLYLSSQEGHIVYVFLYCFFCSEPESRSFYI